MRVWLDRPRAASKHRTEAEKQKQTSKDEVKEVSLCPICHVFEGKKGVN